MRSLFRTTQSQALGSGSQIRTDDLLVMSQTRTTELLYSALTGQKVAPHATTPRPVHSAYHLPARAEVLVTGKHFLESLQGNPVTCTRRTMRRKGFHNIVRFLFRQF